MAMSQASHIQQLASALLSLRQLVDSFVAQSTGHNTRAGSLASASNECEGSDDLESMAGCGSFADLLHQRTGDLEVASSSLMTDPGFVSGSTNTMTSSLSGPVVSAKVVS